MGRKNLQEDNPCLQEQEKTYKCFNKNNFDKVACQMDIDNYKLCKSFWYNIRAQRRREGIYPTLPPPDERDEIKKKFFNDRTTMKNEIPQ